MNITRRRGTDFVSKKKQMIAIEPYSKPKKQLKSNNLSNPNQASQNQKYGFGFLLDPLAAIINPKKKLVNIEMNTKSEINNDFVRFIKNVNKNLENELQKLSTESKLETSQAIENKIDLGSNSNINVSLNNNQSSSVSNVVKLEYTTVLEKIKEFAGKLLDSIKSKIDQQVDSTTEQITKTNTEQNAAESILTSNNDSGNTTTNKINNDEFKKSLQQTFSQINEHLSKSVDEQEFIQNVVSISNQQISNTASYESNSEINANINNNQTIKSLSDLILKFDITEKVLNSINHSNVIKIDNEVFDKLESIKKISSEENKKSEQVSKVIEAGGNAAVNYVSAWGNNFRRFIDSIGDQGSKIVSSSAEAINNILNPIIVLVIAIIIFISLLVFFYYRSKPNIGQVISKISTLTTKDNTKYTNI